MSINSYIARQFGKPTGFGGRIITAIMNRQNLPLYEDTVQHLSPCSSESVLDIGCGNGYMLGMLAARSDCFYVGIDISESILKSTTKRRRMLHYSIDLIMKEGVRCVSGRAGERKSGRVGERELNLEKLKKTDER